MKQIRDRGKARARAAAIASPLVSPTFLSRSQCFKTPDSLQRQVFNLFRFERPSVETSPTRRAHDGRAADLYVYFI